jgi:hypothetical protein
MTSCKGNVIEAVLQTIALCGEHEAALRNHQADAELLRERALDMMQDIEQHLCQLAATFTTAPMCGRIFTPLPHEHTSEQERLESLQLRCALTVRTDEPTSTNCKPTAGQTHRRAFWSFYCAAFACCACHSMLPVLADIEEQAAEREAEAVGRRNLLRMMCHFSTYFTTQAIQGRCADRMRTLCSR